MICVGRPALPIRGTICFTVAGSIEELIIEHSIIFNQLHGRGIEYHFCLLSLLQLLYEQWPYLKTRLERW